MSEDPSELQRFHDETVAPLVAYDEQYETELVRTLESFLDADGNVARTAEKLFTHRHTIRYRLERVKELTGLDVGSTDGRERLGLGLKAMRVLGIVPPGRPGQRGGRRGRPRAARGEGPLRRLALAALAAAVLLVPCLRSRRRRPAISRPPSRRRLSISARTGARRRSHALRDRRPRRAAAGDNSDLCRVFGDACRVKASAVGGAVERDGRIALEVERLHGPPHAPEPDLTVLEDDLAAADARRAPRALHEPALRLVARGEPAMGSSVYDLVPRHRLSGGVEISRCSTSAAASARRYR